MLLEQRWGELSCVLCAVVRAVICKQLALRAQTSSELPDDVLQNSISRELRTLVLYCISPSCLSLFLEQQRSLQHSKQFLRE